MQLRHWFLRLRVRFFRLALSAAAALAFGAPAAMAIAPGDPAPDFTLADVRQNEYTLSAQHGKVVLLAFVGWG